MKNPKTILFLGLGFITIQSCSKQSEICDCTDLVVKVLKSEREHNYDPVFMKKNTEENQAEVAACNKLSFTKVPGALEEMEKERKQCSSYAAYKREMLIAMERLKKQMPEKSKDIDEAIENFKVE